MDERVCARPCWVFARECPDLPAMRSLKSLPVGTTFAVFTGVGAMGITLIGVHFQESSSPARLLSITLILTGDVTVKLLKA